ncbi:EEF1A lysine methyltransferase [Dirofilaria immitis]
MTVSNCQQFARWSYFTWCLHVGLRVYFNLRKSFGLCVEGKKMIDECSANVIEDEIICSKLANKEYWIEHYEKELKNFEEFGDEGEIWFGRVAENRMVNAGMCSVVAVTVTVRRQEGYSHLCGVDYSEEAILLARKLAERKCLENSTDQIDFRVVDLLNENINLGKFDAVLDKGTWDALSLSVDRDCRLRKYKTNICRTLRPFGFFIICSCNYSRNELESHFSSEELEFSEEIPSRNIIEFGGRSGSTTTCVIFRRV